MNVPCKKILSLLTLVVSLVAAGSHAASSGPTKWATITRDNVDRLEQVAMLGQGQFLEMRWLSETTLGVITTAAVWTYSLASADAPTSTYTFQANGLRHATLDPGGRFLALTDDDCTVTLLDMTANTIVPLSELPDDL